MISKNQFSEERFSNSELTPVDICNVCGSRQKTSLYQIRNYHLVTCRDCGLVYVDPRIRHPEVVYSDSYFKDGHGYMDYLSGAKAYNKAFRRILRRLAAYNGAEKGLLVEIGCAAGFFLKEAQKDGWTVRGVELNREMGDYARTQLKLDVTTGSIYDLSLQESTDCICFIDCLEHLEDPKKAVLYAHSCLKPDGILLIAVPNIASWFAKMMRSKWHLLLPEEHLYYFNRKTISRLLMECGFYRMEISPHYYGRTLGELCVALYPAFTNGTVGKWVSRLDLSFILSLGNILVLCRKKPD